MRNEKPSVVRSAFRMVHSALKTRRRRWCWLLVGTVLASGGLLACEGWAAWQQRLAGRALADNQLDEAKQHIDRALQVRRRRTSTLLLAARINRLSGAYSEAEQYLFRCGQLDGMSEPVQLEWLLLRCQQGEVDELSPCLLALVEQRHPEAPAILETLASVYIRQTRYLEALLCLEHWLDRTPDSVRALDWRGWVCNQLDHREQALGNYERLLELQPGRTDIRLRLAQILVESSRQVEAAPHLERLLREAPDNPDVPVALAPCRVVQSRPEEARALLDAVLKDHPDHFDALFQRGKLELTLGHPAEAELWLRKALQVKPQNTEARYSLYRSLQEQPDRQAEAERERTRWEQASKKQDRLTLLLRKDLAAQPNNVELAGEAGELFLQLGEERRGLDWLRRALAINPRHVPSHRALLAYYERTNNTAKADEERRQLAELAATP
jgi:tetratricopeptide (TPR) repeat protein